MPPRKRGSTRGGGKGGGTNAAKRGKVKSDDDGPPPKLKKEESFRTKLQNIIKDEVKTKSQCSKSQKFKPDAVLATQYGVNGVNIHEDFTCMLNQTNIGQNNNKFYVIQVAKTKNNSYVLFTKWGRVGEPGMNSTNLHKNVDDAIKEFKKKFKDKTRNDWDNRENFTASPGKYTLIEMSQESDEDEAEEDQVDSQACLTIPKKNAASKLDLRTQLLIKLIFNDDMFRDQMANMNLDVRKMPLGKLSKGQILKGLEILLDLEKEIKNKANNSKLMELSSKFYTAIPHNFGRTVPPVINSEAVVDQKKDMMMTLTDIEIAQSMKKEQQVEEYINQLDDQYRKTECDLDRIADNSDEYKTILKYATANSITGGKLLDVWKVNRHSEGQRFAQHDNISFRKLLWHGTNVAVVAAILKSGLRIMPHSGGSVGRGIYFASEHAKSWGYVGPHYGEFENESNVGFMFLTEVALGKMKFIKVPDGSLICAPKGFDSIVARGKLEPNPAKDVTWDIDGKKVILPIGKPVSQKEFKDSCFSQSEYLIYKESQARIRYLLKFSFA